MKKIAKNRLNPYPLENFRGNKINDLLLIIAKAYREICIEKGWPYKNVDRIIKQAEGTK